jgi:gluconokinase
MKTNAREISPIERGLCVIVMGVSGSGKTTLAARISGAMMTDFRDADDFHPEENVEKMRQGVALTDTDREPWLHRLNAILRQSETRGESIVLACSALRENYREAIAREVSNVRWVFLDGDFDTIATRIRARSATTNHYMPESLLKSQFETLERPTDAIIVDVALSSDEQLECVMASLRER